MAYPIVQVKTPDGLWLYGLLQEAPGSKTILINTQGTAGNFYEEYFIEVLSQKLPAMGVSFLSSLNRGAYVYDCWQNSGAAIEHFEDCVIDLNSWIAWALDKGYEKIILSGHSLGCEKVVYYTAKGKFADKLAAIILFAPADSYGSHRFKDGQPDTKRQAEVERDLKLAQELVTKGEGDTFLPRNAYGSYDGVMPKSADSFINFLGPDSKVKEGLPFYSHQLPNYRQIKVPILVLIGDEHEYTSLPITEALELMKKENPLTEAHQFTNCNHDFENHEEEVAESVENFVKNL